MCASLHRCRRRKTLPSFAPNLEKSLHRAFQAAHDRHHEYATPEHLLLSLIDDPDAAAVMDACGVDRAELRSTVANYLDTQLDALQVEGQQDPSPSSTFQRVVQRSILHVQSSGREEVSGANVLVALFSERDSYAVYFLQQQDISRLDAVSYISHGVGKTVIRPAAQAPATANVQAASGRKKAAKKPRSGGKAITVSAVAPTPAQSETREIFVSYAWGDNTPEGRAREEVVDKLCNAAVKRGINVIRDRSSLDVGDSISRFMNRIGDGKRVIVVLSDKYLRSPYCMYELNEIWRTSKFDRQAFLERVRVFILADADIATPAAWVKWSLFWKNEYEALDLLARQHGAAILGEHGHQRLLQMQQFYTQVPDILGMIADIVHPRSIEDLERYGFAD